VTCSQSAPQPLFSACRDQDLIRDEDEEKSILEKLKEQEFDLRFAEFSDDEHEREEEEGEEEDVDTEEAEDEDDLD